MLVLGRFEAALGRCGLLLPEEAGAVGEGRRVAVGRALLGQLDLLEGGDGSVCFVWRGRGSHVHVPLLTGSSWASSCGAREG